MKQYMTIAEIEKEAAKEHVTADQLNILVSKARELAHYREHELDKLKGLLDSIEDKLKQNSPPDS